MSNLSLPLEKRDQFAVGDKINDHYRVDAILGKGGSSIVYRISDLVGALPARAQALKMILHERNKADFLEFFKVEFKTMREL